MSAYRSQMVLAIISYEIVGMVLAPTLILRRFGGDLPHSTSRPGSRSCITPSSWTQDNNDPAVPLYSIGRIRSPKPTVSGNTSCIRVGWSWNPDCSAKMNSSLQGSTCHLHSDIRRSVCVILSRGSALVKIRWQLLQRIWQAWALRFA